MIDRPRETSDAATPAELLTGDHARAVQLIRERGYAVVPDVLTPNEAQDYRLRLDAIYSRQADEVGVDTLEATGELHVARCLLAYDSAFLEMVQHSLVLAIVRALIGDYVVLHLQNGILVNPGVDHHQTAWHRDLPHQQFTSSRPLAVNALVCLDDFDASTGGTHFVPGSHLRERMTSDEDAARSARQPEAPAGSAILFDSMVCHRAGRNSSRGTRRGINHVFTTGILRQQIDLPSFLPVMNADLHRRCVSDPELRVLLGYDCRTAPSVGAFRRRRLAKLTKAPSR